MSAGKTLIGGTAYTIKSGKTLVGGTAYTIKKGKTLIGGTNYSISLQGIEKYQLYYDTITNTAETTVTVSLPENILGLYFVVNIVNNSGSTYYVASTFLRGDGTWRGATGIGSTTYQQLSSISISGNTLTFTKKKRNTSTPDSSYYIFAITCSLPVTWTTVQSSSVSSGSSTSISVPANNIIACMAYRTSDSSITDLPDSNIYNCCFVDHNNAAVNTFGGTSGSLPTTAYSGGSIFYVYNEDNVKYPLLNSTKNVIRFYNTASYSVYFVYSYAVLS